MEKFKVTFEANDQQLKSLGTKHASDTYADIEATFVFITEHSLAVKQFRQY